jgi:hypothetical protein
MEGSAAGLRENGTGGFAVSRGQLQGTEGAQIDHSNNPARGVTGGDGWGTVR